MENPYDTKGFEKSQEPIVMDNIINEPMKTSVDTLEADGYYAKGIDKTPIFDVEKSDFYNNMTADRQRIRFKSGSKAQRYAQETKNNQFFIRYTDDNKRQYIRKVK